MVEELFLGPMSLDLRSIRISEHPSSVDALRSIPLYDIIDPFAGFQSPGGLCHDRHQVVANPNLILKITQESFHHMRQRV